LLLPALERHSVCVFLSSKVGGSNQKVPQLDTLKFFEQRLFNQLISPLLNSINNDSALKSFEQLDKFLSQPLEELNLINSPEGLVKIKSLQPDLVISIRYGNILKTDVLNIPRLGVLNLHSGLLPDYRGVMATFWAMLKDEQQIGTTLHYIDDSSIDTGRIISTSKLKVDREKSYLWHVLQLYIAGVELILNAVDTIEKNGQAEAYSQIDSGQYFSFPNEKDLLEFSRKGLSLIDENEIVDFIHTHYY
jgi:methionyl-tRNA formyltransferase